MKANNILSERGETLKMLGKAAFKYNNTLPSGIEYRLMDLIDKEIEQKNRLEIKIDTIKGIRELMRQYKQLFNDYTLLNSDFKEEENPFDVILKNPESAYNKMDDLIEKLSIYF